MMKRGQCGWGEDAPRLESLDLLPRAVVETELQDSTAPSNLDVLTARGSGTFNRRGHGEPEVVGERADLRAGVPISGPYLSLMPVRAS